jgi:predicted nucleic acid-binding protein
VTAYPDTSFLIALYRWQANSYEAIAHIEKMAEPLHVTPLVLFEFRQSIRLQEFLHHRNPQLGFDRATGQAAFAKLQSNIASGGLVTVHADWDDVLRLAEKISDRYTPREGYRSFDILNVATALHFGAKEFLTFDLKQKKMAKALGLKAPL